MSWRPACSTTSTAGSASTPASAEVHARLERIEHRHLVAHRHLDQAEQRPVAALGHELGVDRQPPLRARTRRQALRLSRQRSPPGCRNWVRIIASQAVSGSSAREAIRRPPDGVTV